MNAEEQTQEEDRLFMERYYSCKCTTCRNAKDDLLRRLIEHWMTYFYQCAWPMNEQDFRYIKENAQEVEREFLVDLLILNLTNTDFVEQGNIIRNLSRDEDFSIKLADRGERQMLKIVETLTDSALDNTIWRMAKLISVVNRFEEILYQEKELREKRKLSSP
jgi:hypothetical protein